MKKKLRTLVHKLGINISRNFGFSPGIYNSSYLSRLLSPDLVIDVGVGFGTHELYAAFPAADFLLIEPLQEYKAAIDGISASYSCETIYKAVGKEPGHLEINVAPDDPQLSSLLERSDLTAEGLKSEKRTIEVTTLDSIFAGKQLPAKTLLKIDTEGNELAVLQGAEEILPRIDCVIAEASIAPRFKDGYRFDDLVAFLADRGFELYSFLYITHKVEEMQPRFADVVFMRSDAAATGNG